MDTPRRAGLAAAPPFLRAIAVGVVATAVDLLVLFALVQGLGMSPAAANVPALLAGLAVQFLGCRAVVFAGSDRPLVKQALGFVVAEAGTLALNAVTFHLLVTLTRVPYAGARPLGQLVVFVAFSYPAWRRVFRGRSGAAEREEHGQHEATR
jgi:putative flippase GtrA